MYKPLYRMLVCFTASLMLVFANSASAAVVNSVKGIVDGANTGNDFGITTGYEFFATFIYDDSGLTNTGPETITFDTNGLGNTFSFTIGSVSFSQGDDTFGGAILNFDDGAFDGFEFDTDPGSPVEFSSFGTGSVYNFTGGDSATINGHWDGSTFGAAVPVPAAVWLFVSGLLGLAGVARRNINRF